MAEAGLGRLIAEVEATPVEQREGPLKRLARALGLAEHDLAEMRGALGGALYLVHQDGQVVQVSDRLVHFLDRAERMLLGRGPSEIAHADEVPYIRERIEGVYETGQPSPPARVRLLRADGSPAFVDAIGCRVRFKGRRAILVLFFDISRSQRYARSA